MSFWVSCELRWRVLISYVFTIVIVTYGELTVRFLLIRVVNDTNVTTTECWTSFRITNDCELRKVKVKFLIHVNRKNKTLQRLVSHPMLFLRIPFYRGITTYSLPKLIMNQRQGVGQIITKLMKLLDRKIMLGRSINQTRALDDSTFKEPLNRWQII